MGFNYADIRADNFRRHSRFNQRRLYRLILATQYNFNLRKCDNVGQLKFNKRLHRTIFTRSRWIYGDWRICRSSFNSKFRLTIDSGFNTWRDMCGLTGIFNRTAYIKTARRLFSYCNSRTR